MLSDNNNNGQSGTSPSDYQLLGPPSTFGVSPNSSSQLRGYMQLQSNQQKLSSLSLTSVDDFQSESGSFTDNNCFLNYLQSNSNNNNNSNSNSSHLVTKKTLFYLTTTLNESFSPDYDFSGASSSEFSKEPSIEYLKKDVDNYLASVDIYHQLKQQLWQSIDKEINLAESDYYRFGILIFYLDPFV